MSQSLFVNAKMSDYSCFRGGLDKLGCVCVSVLKMIMEQKVERLFGNNVNWEIVLKSGKVHFRQRTRLQKVTKTPLSVS